MNNSGVKTITKILVALSFALMVTVNVLANSLPINGQNTGQISDSYFNLFAPAGLTFIIWGVIYILLALYTIYQFGLFQKADKIPATSLMERISPFFILSSLLNTVWIFAWHYNLIAVCLVLIAGMLVLLARINLLIDKEKLSNKEKFFIRLPFSVYFGWVTVATIANATTLLVDLGWNGFGISEVIWTVIILLVGAAIGFATIKLRRDIAYGLVLIWSYGGILLKHISEDGFAMAYPPAYVTAGICIGIFIVAVLLSFSGKKPSIA